MQIDFQLNNIDYSVSDSLMRNIMDYRVGLHEFSVFERFVDFFYYLFTGESVISDYREIYEILYPNIATAEISDPLSLTLWRTRSDDPTEWRPIVGFVRLIDQSRSDVIKRYAIAENKQGDTTSLITMSVDGIIIAEAICSDESLLFLKTHLYNENSNKIILTKEMDSPEITEGIYAQFENLLKEHLLTQIKLEEVIKVAPSIDDIEYPAGKENNQYAEGLGFKLALSPNSTLMKHALTQSD